VKIKDRLDEVIEGKARKLRESSLQQLRHKAETLERFLAKRGVTEASQVTVRDVLNFMNGWRYNDSTAIIQTTALRFFLKKLGRADIAGEIERPRETRQGREQRRPCPYSDAEIKAFRAVADARTELFFLASIQTGLAVADLVQLRPENLRDGCVITSRQKTNKPVVIPIETGLYERLRVALPFYSGRRWQTGVTIWSERIRVTQQKAGIWRKGNLVHRGRDSFVERQLQAGIRIQIVAARLGDLVSTVEKHYADLLSPRMRDANLEAPVVSV
jgi:site-specific recombinase XerD